MTVPRPREKICQSSDLNEVMVRVVNFADSKHAYLTRHTSQDLRIFIKRGWVTLSLWKNPDVSSPKECLGQVWLIYSRFLFWTTYKAYFHPVE